MGCAAGAQSGAPVTSGLSKTATPHAVDGAVYSAATDALQSQRGLGADGPYRANNDLLHYTLDVRVDPVEKSIRGTNAIRFRMLADGTRIQLELVPELSIDGVRMGRRALSFEREGATFFVNTPKQMRRGKVYEITVAYSGKPKEVGRFGGMVFTKDPVGRPWVVTSCEDEGARVWWPNKDQWKDEPQDGVDLHVAVPDGLTAVSNGRLRGSKNLHDGYTRWDWRVTYPINNYDVALNIATYSHFSDQLGKLSLDYYVLPEDLEKAKVQFAQAKPMLQVYQKYFGEYPFVRDGYKVVQVPYSGMEHQTAVAYGNGFHNSYLHNNHDDWTGVGISPRFDFILIHESGHEWFGNSVTAADPADMWIHEGFTTYMEAVYVEAMYGHADEVKYINSFQHMVYNKRPILQPRWINQSPDRDQYFKGALLLNTLRNAVNDDAKWFATLHGFAETFKYKTILTEDVVSYFNEHLGADYTPVFNAYLKYAHIPVLELSFNDAAGTVEYRWQTPETDFNLLVHVGDASHWTVLHPTTAWQTTTGRRGAFAVDTQSAFIRVDEDPDRSSLEKAGYTLTWHDEFDGPNDSAPDAAKWTAETGGGGFGNNELETYTTRLQNAAVRDGVLEITARREHLTGGDGVAREYTSARLKTQGKFEQKYGRVEARMKLPAGGQGLWPAFWMLGGDIGTTPWPASGEIDIMEQIGKEPGTVHGTLHGPGYSAGNALTGQTSLANGEMLRDRFHTFAVEWEPAAIRFYVDDRLYETRTPADLPAGAKWVFDHPFFALLNLAVGGGWPGNPDATTVLPSAMQVDWVRAYSRSR